MSEATTSAKITTAPQRKNKQVIGLIVGILISIGILAVFFASIDYSSFIEEFRRIEIIYIPLFVLCFFATYWIRAFRWRYLLPESDSLHLRTLFDAFSLGALGMFLLPFRAGELIRAYTLQRWQNVSFAVGFASIITERAFDVLSLLILFGICLTQIEEAPSEVLAGAWVLGCIAGAILGVMLMCYFFADQMLALFRWKLRFVLRSRLPEVQKKLIEFAAGIIEGFRAIKSGRELAIVMASSLGLWLVFGLLAQVVFWCFGEFPTIWVGITVNVIIALAIAIPSAPGFLGVFQLGCVLALSGIFGYSKEFALAYAVLSHSLQFLIVLTIGFWVLHKRGIRLRDLRRK